MKQYINKENKEQKKKLLKKKKEKTSEVTKKDYGLTENAKIILE